MIHRHILRKTSVRIRVWLERVYVCTPARLKDSENTNVGTHVEHRPSTLGDEIEVPVILPKLVDFMKDVRFGRPHAYAIPDAADAYRRFPAKCIEGHQSGGIELRDEFDNAEPFRPSPPEASIEGRFKSQFARLLRDTACE